MQKRRKNRLREYNYAGAGYYYVTVCAAGRGEWLGEIRNREMVLNDWGRIVEACWLDLPNHYAGVKLDRYVVMPNHFHGIVVIHHGGNKSTTGDESIVGNGLKPFPTNVPAPMPSSENTPSRPQKRHGLSEIMRGFKTFSARRINEKLPGGERFRWQKSFYDRVIRHDQELNRIREYICQNPSQWGIDPENRNLKPMTPEAPPLKTFDF
ncbi:MAG: transposase [Candidatus Omnitrophica bacterium]|nr:transposase [Candidatus Omnitrophota bacterium]